MVNPIEFDLVTSESSNKEGSNQDPDILSQAAQSQPSKLLSQEDSIIDSEGSDTTPKGDIKGPEEVLCEG